MNILTLVCSVIGGIFLCFWSAALIYSLVGAILNFFLGDIDTRITRLENRIELMKKKAGDA